MIAPDTFPEIAVEHFQPDASFLRGFDFMIRYSTSSSTARLTNLNGQAELNIRIEKEYRELLALRERVKKAEVAAKHARLRVKLKTCARPVVRRVASRRPFTRSGEFTKCQLYAMLAEAVRNTH
jgi:hypothetical protein